MHKEAVYLETSIQILRRFHSPDARVEAGKIIKQFPITLSSTYVRMEYFYSIIRDLIYLYDISKRINNFGEIYYRIEKLPPIQRRKLNRVLEGIGSFFIDQDGDTLDLNEKLQSWLRQTIDDALVCFNESVDSICDETSCAKARVAPRKNGETYLPFERCKVSNKQCKIDEFFEKHLGEFKSILDMLNKITPGEKDDELKRMEGVLEKAINYPKNMLDYKNCRKCGDAIISIECPTKAALFTLNTKHYQLINSVVGKQLINISSTPKELEG